MVSNFNSHHTQYKLLCVVRFNWTKNSTPPLYIIWRCTCMTIITITLLPTSVSPFEYFGLPFVAFNFVFFSSVFSQKDKLFSVISFCWRSNSVRLPWVMYLLLLLVCTMHANVEVREGLYAVVRPHMANTRQHHCHYYWFSYLKCDDGNDDRRSSRPALRIDKI